MTSDLRTVIDTGVVVSALLLPRSVPRQAFDVAATRGRLLVSDETIAELDDVLRRPKFDKHVFRFTSAVDAHANVRPTGVKSIQIFGAFDNAPVSPNNPLVKPAYFRMRNESLPSGKHAS